ncbi:hypothetical protein C0993_003818, partial [Termitomyces sp. T159_Od127]
TPSKVSSHLRLVRIISLGKMRKSNAGQWKRRGYYRPFAKHCRNVKQFLLDLLILLLHLALRLPLIPPRSSKPRFGV